MRNDTTRTNPATPYPAWLHGIWILPPGSASYESIQKAEQDAANEGWEDEGGSVGATKEAPKMPF